MNYSGLNSRVGTEIRERRRLLRLTQREVADLAELAPATVIAIERGSPTVRLGSLLKAIQVLGFELRVGLIRTADRE